MGQIHLLVYTGAAANFTLQTSGGSRPSDKTGGGGGGGHPDNEISGGPASQKTFFKFGLKMRRGLGPLCPLDPPLQTRFHTLRDMHDSKAKGLGGE